MKRIVLLLNVAVFGLQVYSQELDNDSLWNVWEDEFQPDSDRLKAINKLARSDYFLYSQPDSADLLAQLHYDYAQSIGNKKEMVMALSTRGIAFDIMGDYTKAMDYHTRGLEISKEIGHRSGEAKSLINIGILHDFQGKYSEALDYYNQSLKISEDIGDKHLISTALINIGVVYDLLGDYSRAMDFFSRSLVINRVLGNKRKVASILKNMGNIYFFQGNYQKAIDLYSRSLAIEETLENKMGIADAVHNIGNVYFEQQNYSKALQHYGRSLELKEEIGDKKGTADLLHNLGIVHIKQGNPAKALDVHHRALDIYKETGDKQGSADVMNGIGESYYIQGNLEDAMKYYTQGFDIAQGIGHKAAIAVSLNGIGMVYEKRGDVEKAINNYTQSLKIAEDVGDATKIRGIANNLYLNYKALGRMSKALEMHELYVKMRDSIASEENQRAIIRQEYKYEYEKEALADSLEFAKESLIKDVEIEKQEVYISRQRIALASTVGGLLLILALAFSVYRGKKRSDELLLNILPEETAQELKKKGYADAKQFDQVTVLFTDFKGFTQISERLAPSELVSAIDECFKAFDTIMEKYGIEKIKTIGDAYMAAGGLPVANRTNAIDVLKAGIEIRDWMLNYRKEKGDNGFEIRIGIHTGPVVAGIVGIKKYSYDIWGDTVNTASRMESNGEVGKVNISETTYEIAKDHFDFNYRGEVKVKGKGDMKMYFAENIYRQKAIEGSHFNIKSPPKG